MLRIAGKAQVIFHPSYLGQIDIFSVLHENRVWRERERERKWGWEHSKDKTIATPTPPQVLQRPCSVKAAKAYKKKETKTILHFSPLV